MRGEGQGDGKRCGKRTKGQWSLSKAAGSEHGGGARGVVAGPKRMSGAPMRSTPPQRWIMPQRAGGGEGGVAAASVCGGGAGSHEFGCGRRRRLGEQIFPTSLEGLFWGAPNKNLEVTRSLGG